MPNYSNTTYAHRYLHTLDYIQRSTVFAEFRILDCRQFCRVKKLQQLIIIHSVTIAMSLYRSKISSATYTDNR
jgi:hypothetical protein